MDHTAPQCLIEHFSKLEDPRVYRNKKHELMDVVVRCVCAMLSGAEGWCDIEEFGRTKLDWLRRYVPLANGIPVDDTIARIISALSVKGFQECFLSWMENVVKFSEGEIIALDGKTHRRSHDGKRGVKALHMVSAWGCRNGVVLGQVKTDEKSNEITAVPELLEKLELKGCVVTLGKRCREMGVLPSMGLVGDCYDNAMAKSFFATLEWELLDRRKFPTRAEARMAVFEYIEGWYNPHRRHSGLGYRSPLAFERSYPQAA